MREDKYVRNVFLNCPFDTDYKPIFEALLFAIMDCGFLVRTAFDVSDSSQVRIAKLYDTIAACRLGIHDLSRTELSPATSLPRFNMPLEFGLFLGAKAFGDQHQRDKVCLVFDSLPFRYQAYISDIAGQDIAAHQNDPKNALIAVRNWLASVTNGPLPSGSFVWTRYQTFRAELPESCEQFRQEPTELTYHEYLNQVGRFRLLKEERLEIEKGKAITDPNPRAVAAALRALNDNDNTFAIYVRGGNGGTYMQTACKGADAFILEYQEGSLDHHYVCVNKSLSCEQIIDVFQRYVRAVETWKEEYTWEKLDL
jgi:hypothetical protein